MGRVQEDVMSDWNNISKTVSVSSFYIDETEVTNIDYVEYLEWIKKHYIYENEPYSTGMLVENGIAIYEKALPDTLVWRSELAYNDPYVDHYLRYPGFRYFPVVGVNWEQAGRFADWRTFVVNNKLAQDAGVEVPESGDGRIPLETGVVLPNYRLPSEAEWEYAAKALIGNQWLDENQTHSRLYPWDGQALRNPYGREMGTFLANFKRGRGDYAGIAGKLNDGAMITDYIYNYPPNDFGLYNMAGNVNEWVADVYRPLSFQKMDDLNPFRRNGYLDEEDGYDKKGFQSLVSNKSRVFEGGSWRHPISNVFPRTTFKYS
jgi:gliding motility-associated lipoprotein GldJ